MWTPGVWPVCLILVVVDVANCTKAALRFVAPWLPQPTIIPTHTFMTDNAIQAVGRIFPEANTFRQALIDGANAEMHELPNTVNHVPIASGGKLTPLYVRLNADYG